MSPSPGDEIRLGWTDQEWEELTQEAEKRGISVDDVVAELAMEALIGKAQTHRAQVTAVRHLRAVK